MNSNMSKTSTIKKDTFSLLDEDLDAKASEIAPAKDKVQSFTGKPDQESLITYLRSLPLAQQKDMAIKQGAGYTTFVAFPFLTDEDSTRVAARHYVNNRPYICLADTGWCPLCTSRAPCLTEGTYKNGYEASVTFITNILVVQEDATGSVNFENNKLNAKIHVFKFNAAKKRDFLAALQEVDFITKSKTLDKFCLLKVNLKDPKKNYLDFSRADEKIQKVFRNQFIESDGNSLQWKPDVIKSFKHSAISSKYLKRFIGETKTHEELVREFRLDDVAHILQRGGFSSPNQEVHSSEHFRSEFEPKKLSISSKQGLPVEDAIYEEVGQSIVEIPEL